MTGMACTLAAAPVTCLTSWISPDCPVAQIADGVWAMALSRAACAG